MKSILTALALSGCAVGVAYVPDDYYVCEEAAAPVQFCEQYYGWVPGYYSYPYSYWHPGHYEIRPGWSHRGSAPAVRDHRYRVSPTVRDHRR